MGENIVNGVTIFDPHHHVVGGRYKEHATEDDPGRVEVIEVANTRLQHTRVIDGHPDGRIAVFTRFITLLELNSRIDQYQVDPVGFVGAMPDRVSM